MESVTGGEECLEEKKGDTEQEPAKTPSKKKKKKKKKNKNSTVEASGSAELLTEESVSINVEETQQTDCKTIAEEKPEIDAQHGDEKNSSEDEGSLLRNKDELKQYDLVGDGDVAEEKKPPNSSSEVKSSKKRKKKNSTLDNVVADEKEIELVTPPGEVDKSDFTNEKPDDNETSSETPDLVPQKPCDKEKSNSPVINRKKKKKKKTGGFLLSDLDLTEPQNDSNKEKEDGKVVAEKQGKSLCDKNVTVIPAERESDLANFTDDKSLLMLETREKNNLSKILIITNGLGLDTLRKVFQQIHPSWSNKPDDAKNLDKGKIKLQNHELARFNTGNINNWDISLITTVLLYSTKCANELALKPGFEGAIRSIKVQKNQLISHVNSERMTNDKFNIAWDKMSKSLETLGASRKDIDDVQSDDVLEDAKFYRDVLLQEMAFKDAIVQDINTKIDNMGDEVAEKVVQKLADKSSAKNENQPSFQDLSGPRWDEWIRFCDNVQNFDHDKNNYILITDRMSPENVEHFSILRSVPWKIVLDFDPSSEERGMYHAFQSKDGQNSIIDMMTPNEIRRDHSSTVSLARHIDSRKTQWLFVKGRERDDLADCGSENLQDWKSLYLKHVSGFLRCCSDPEKIDKHKPVICVILPFLQATTPFLKVTLERLVENFDEFSLSFVGVKHDNIHELDFSVRLTELPPHLLSLGLTNLLQAATGKEYRMPTSQAKLTVNLTNHQLLFLQEYLDVMYNGCEDLPTVDSEEDEEKLKKILNDHKESFLSGNWISFVGLYDNHDARRELSEEVRCRIQRLLEQGRTHSTILGICHSPGTGGTTIARRVLWDLHKSYPCAIAKLEDYRFDFDDDFLFINNLADRISAMQNICNMTPLILLDGNHSRIEHLSSKLVRVLISRGQRAILLSCMHRLTKASDKEANPETSDVHARFDVNVKLEESVADLRQFEDKYKDFIDKVKNTDKWSPKRVFHFPLLAMLVGLEGFDYKLKCIIYESFDALDGLRKQIAAVVAFIQFYSSQATPASLLNKAYKQHVRQGGDDKGITYEDISQLITDQLLSLMVPARPSRYRHRTTSSSVSESYTLQHPHVAELVLQRYYETQKCDIFGLTRDVLKFPIFQGGDFFSLLYALFIRNRSSLPNARFSILFEKLNSLNARVATEIFRELAVKTGDATVFAHAARFHAKSNPPLFSQAKDLITEAFRCKNAQSRKRMIYEFKGNILQSELRALVDKNKIKSISKLEEVADEAVKSYKSSTNWPPTYPWPLIGEVKVWVSCIEWITKNKCNGDTDKAFEYISSEAPPFFRTCVGDSFYLLDLVNDIVQKEANMTDPEGVQKQSNDLRLSLLKTFNKDIARRGSNKKASGWIDKDQDIVRACEALCSKDKFPNSSPFELKRLQVHYILSSIGQLEAASNTIIEFLLKMLEDLKTDKQSVRVGMARHLMKVCLFSPKEYSLDKGLRVAEMWMQESGYDPLPYFYKMTIAFLMILDGNQIFYRDTYHKALNKCKENSQNHLRRYISTHFLRKTGEGMNRLMTKRALLSGETEYQQNIDDFWTTISRKKLKECTGRIKIRPKLKSGKRNQVYIELVEGNIELYVGKNADIGEVERDFTQGTIVYFVVSFTLEGPVANGITLKPTSS